MALGAFNDNFYKNAVIILITFRLAESLHRDAALLISLAAACFILPFFLFSGIAGILADRHAKHTLFCVLKLTELALCALAGVALYIAHIPLLFLVLFLFGTQSAFFGPVKYAILPELLKSRELLAANGMIEAGTFIGILIGTIAGGLLILAPNGVALVSITLLALGAAGVGAAMAVLPTTSTHPNLAEKLHVIATTKAMLTRAMKNPPIWYAILGISWFWATGTTYLTQIPVFTKESIGGNAAVASFFLGLFSVGIAFGSLSCQRVMHVWPKLPLAPLALGGITLAGLHLCFTASGLTPGDSLMGLDRYFDARAHAIIALDLFLLSVCGGLFIVPLYTQLQIKSSAGERARSIASNNVMNALFSSVSALAVAALYAAKFHVNDVLLIAAVANIPVLLILLSRRKKRR